MAFSSYSKDSAGTIQCIICNVCRCSTSHIEHNYVTVVYMARDVMILMRANPFRGSLEGVDSRNGTAQKRFSGPTPMLSKWIWGGGRGGCKKCIYNFFLSFYLLRTALSELNKY